MLAATLKSWGLPFDVLRFDQQRVDRYLLDQDGRPRYGTIIWDAGPGDYGGKGLEVAAGLVRKNGLGLLVVGDGAATPEIATLPGVRVESDFISPPGSTSIPPGIWRSGWNTILTIAAISAAPDLTGRCVSPTRRADAWGRDGGEAGH
jgi:hypothetical protein